MRLPFVALILMLASTPVSADTIAGRASVIDGDTLEIHAERIRILDVDAPESAQYCFKSSADLETGAWPCGRRAALALSDWLGEQTVTCETTTQETTELFKTWWRGALLQAKTWRSG